MSEDKKKFNPRFVSPRGVARYPWLNKPDTKYNPEGEYKVTLQFADAELDKPITHKKFPEYDGKTLRQILDEAAEAAYQEARSKAKNAADKKKIQKADPYQPVCDEEGNETGDVTLHFKMRAKVTTKKTREVFEQKPFMVDAKRNPTTAVVFGGSELKISFEVIPYFVASSKTAGVTLRMKNVQVLSLAERQSGGADEFDEEEGYEGDTGEFGDDAGDDAGDGAGW